VRERVRERARQRCEYCGISEAARPALRHHVEHIVPRKHDGGDGEENLALACHSCNLRKGTNLSGIDPETGAVVQLFNPRRQNWSEHFTFNEAVVTGLTPCGRATVRVLGMNARSMVELRSSL
jgi:hypothetical protein